MANIVQLKRSSVSGRVPDAANVEIGEPVVNLADQILYTKDGSGTIKVIGAGTTSNISEGTNLYFTNARSVAALTAGTNITIDANGLISSSATGGGGGSGESVSFAITQVSHDFEVGNVLYFDGSDYIKADASNSQTLGIFVVSSVDGVDDVTVTFSGKITLSGLTPGEYYFVSEDGDGVYTPTEPTAGYSNPILFALSTTDAVVLPYRPSPASIQGALPISDGGTGASNANDALTNLGAVSSSTALAFAIAMG